MRLRLICLDSKTTHNACKSLIHISHLVAVEAQFASILLADEKHDAADDV